MEDEINVSQTFASDHESEDNMAHRGRNSFGGETRNESFKSQLAGAISILLAISTLIIVSVFSTTAIISNQPNSTIDSDIVVEPLYRTGSVFMCVVLFLMAIQVGIFRKRNDPSFVADVKYNKFLLYSTVFIFMPAAEIYLVVRLITDILEFNCEDHVYQVRSVLEVIFILAVGLYTWQMVGKRVIGSEPLVISVKATIASVAVTCISIWTYRVHVNGATIFALIIRITRKEMLECGLNNKTINLLGKFETLSHYMSPFLLELCLSCSALLYASFHKSKIGLVFTEEVVQKQRPQIQFPPIPIILGLVILFLCIVSLGIDLWLGQEGLLKDLLIYEYIQYFVLIACIILNGLLFYQFIHYKPCRVEIQTDRTLLWFSSAATVIYSMFHCHGSAVLLTRNTTALGLPNMSVSEVKGDAIFCVLLFVQTLSQAVVLDVGLRRRGGAIPPIVQKCQPALILLFANIGFWLDTLYLSNLIYHFDIIYMKIYGKTVWNVVRSICQPLFSLHKIQCASIFYEIYRDAGHNSEQ